ncbi:MAG: DUF3520 domain-containing protein [Armatimonadetes bacterium]|nr:DUF3520 domain-containing protein [Armatimonadota bacterium]
MKGCSLQLPPSSASTKNGTGIEVGQNLSKTCRSSGASKLDQDVETDRVRGAGAGRPSVKKTPEVSERIEELMAHDAAGDKLRYQQTPAAKSEELCLVKLRYKKPGGDVSRLLTFAVPRSRVQTDIARTSDDFRFRRPWPGSACCSRARRTEGSGAMRRSSLWQRPPEVRTRRATVRSSWTWWRGPRPFRGNKRAGKPRRPHCPLLRRDVPRPNLPVTRRLARSAFSIGRTRVSRRGRGRLLESYDESQTFEMAAREWFSI